MNFAYSEIAWRGWVLGWKFVRAHKILSLILSWVTFMKERERELSHFLRTLLSLYICSCFSKALARIISTLSSDVRAPTCRRKMDNYNVSHRKGASRPWITQNYFQRTRLQFDVYLTSASSGNVRHRKIHAGRSLSQIILFLRTIFARSELLFVAQIALIGTRQPEQAENCYVLNTKCALHNSCDAKDWIFIVKN